MILHLYYDLQNILKNKNLHNCYFFLFLIVQNFIFYFCNLASKFTFATYTKLTHLTSFNYFLLKHGDDRQSDKN